MNDLHKTETEEPMSYEAALQVIAVVGGARYENVYWPVAVREAFQNESPSARDHAMEALAVLLGLPQDRGLIIEQAVALHEAQDDPADDDGLDQPPYPGDLLEDLALALADAWGGDTIGKPESQEKAISAFNAYSAEVGRHQTPDRVWRVMSELSEGR